MADFVSAPEIESRDTILLYGNYYQIAGPVRVDMATVSPEKMSLSPGVPAGDSPLISTITVNDLRGGMGLFRYRDLKDLNRYATGINFAPRFAHSITPSLLANSSSKPSGETATVNAITALSGTIIVAFGPDLYNLTPPTTWSASTDTLPATPVDDIWFNARIFFALDSSGYSYLATAGGVATDVAAGASDPAAHSFAVWDETLYAIDTAGRLWSSTTGNAASWTGLANLPVPNTTDIDLVVYDDSAGDPTIWALTAFGPWIYDPINDKWFQSRFQFPEFDRVVTGRGMGIDGRDALFVKGSDHQLYKTRMSNTAYTVENVTPGINFLPSAYAGEITSIVADNHHLYVLIGDSSTISGINWCVFVYNDDDDVPVWHPLSINTADNSTQPLVAAIIASSVGHRLYYHDNNSADGHIVRWIELLDLERDPSQFATVNYAASAQVDLPWFDNFEESRDKLALRVRVKCLGMSANETITVSYRTDFSTGSFTTLGSAIAANGETTIWFGTNNVGMSFKSIQFRLAFARGSTTTNAPKLESFSFDYMRLPEVLRGFTVQIICSGMFFNKSAGEQLENLWTMMKTDTMGTFAYLDDTGQRRSYLVKPQRPQGVEMAGSDEHGTYAFYLAEIRSNN